MRRPRCVMLLKVASTACGCAGMPVRERGNPAAAHTAADPLPGPRGLNEHVYSSREAGSAGAGGQGGGRGCD